MLIARSRLKMRAGAGANTARHSKAVRSGSDHNAVGGESFRRLSQASLAASGKGFPSYTFKDTIPLL
jgi:hypothetical protein